MCYKAQIPYKISKFPANTISPPGFILNVILKLTIIPH